MENFEIIWYCKISRIYVTFPISIIIYYIVSIFAIKDDKIGLAVGVTDKLTKKYDAVKFAKIGSEIVGGKGGGGRPDFAQAGGMLSDKIEEAFTKLKSLI